MSNLGAPLRRNKGKGHTSSPISIHDNSDLDVAGFANNPQTGNNSGEEDKEDKEYGDKDEEDKEYGDKNEDKAENRSSSVMDVL